MRAFPFALLVVLSACKVPERPPAFSEAQTLGGVSVPADVLNHGHMFYGLHCAGCHGANGNGKGPVGVQQIPAPRDLRLGILKYASVPAGQLPTDADLHHLMVTGLRGTGMQPWRFRDEEVTAVTQYIKTLSPRWLSETPGTPVDVEADPFGGATASALERGRALYHATEANCTTCHVRYDGEHTHPPIATDTAFGAIVAPDLKRPPKRTGDSAASVYKIIATGVGGTGMVPMYDKLSGEDLWALTYYVLSLRS